MSRTDLEILTEEVAELHARWEIVAAWTNEDAIDSLNAVAPSAFRCIHDAIVDSVILGVVRIVSDGNSRTLTIEKLITEMQQSQKQTELNKQVTNLKRDVNGMLQHRHNRIAHLNHKAATGITQIPPVNRDEINEALKSIASLLSDYSIETTGTELGFDGVLARGNGDSIVSACKAAVRLTDLENMAWGNTHPTVIKEELRKRVR